MSSLSSLVDSWCFPQVLLDYFPVLQAPLIEPLVDGIDGIDVTIKFMDNYSLNRDDWDSVRKRVFRSFTFTLTDSRTVSSLHF